MINNYHCDNVSSYPQSEKKANSASQNLLFKTWTCRNSCGTLPCLHIYRYEYKTIFFYFIYRLIEFSFQKSHQISDLYPYKDISKSFHVYLLTRRFRLKIIDSLFITNDYKYKSYDDNKWNLLTTKGLRKEREGRGREEEKLILRENISVCGRGYRNPRPTVCMGNPMWTTYIIEKCFNSNNKK